MANLGDKSTTTVGRLSRSTEHRESRYYSQRGLPQVYISIKKAQQESLEAIAEGLHYQTCVRLLVFTALLPSKPMQKGSINDIEPTAKGADSNTDDIATSGF
jgi:hypothetical protein